MPPLSPVSRRELVRRLRELGFRGPYSGGRHEFMIRETQRLTLPSPHRGDIGVALLSRLLRQAGVTVEEWNVLGS
jgi:predicted RNA binding protein YcfA (HicA-like mRNA interferase family)